MFRENQTNPNRQSQPNFRGSIFDSNGYFDYDAISKLVNDTDISNIFPTVDPSMVNFVKTEFISMINGTEDLAVEDGCFWIVSNCTVSPYILTDPSTSTQGVMFQFNTSTQVTTFQQRNDYSSGFNTSILLNEPILLTDIRILNGFSVIGYFHKFRILQ